MKGKQSELDTAFVLLPPVALYRCASVLYQGTHYEPKVDGVTSITLGDENWRHISVLDHINHAMAHINLYLLGDKSEYHLANATVRLLFALELNSPNKDTIWEITNA